MERRIFLERLVTRTVLAYASIRYLVHCGTNSTSVEALTSPPSESGGGTTTAPATTPTSPSAPAPTPTATSTPSPTPTTSPSPEPPLTGTCSSGTEAVYTNPGHPHSGLTLTGAQIFAAVPGSYTLLSGGHTHTFALDASDFATLRAGGTIFKTDQEGHGHTISLTC